MDLDAKKFDPQPEDARIIFGTLRDFAEFVVQDGSESIFPTMAIRAWDPFADKVENMLVAMDLEFNSSKGKSLAMKKMAAMLYRDHKLPCAVGLISEAWMSKPQENEEEYRKKYLMIADDPNKDEVIQVSALGFPVNGFDDWKGVIDSRKIVHAENGNIVWDGDWQYTDKPEITADCNLLEKFFVAYIRFVQGAENPDHYLPQTVQEFQRT